MLIVDRTWVIIWFSLSLSLFEKKKIYEKTSSESARWFDIWMALVNLFEVRPFSFLSLNWIVYCLWECLSQQRPKTLSIRINRYVAHNWFFCWYILCVWSQLLFQIGCNSIARFQEQRWWSTNLFSINHSTQYCHSANLGQTERD